MNVTVKMGDCSITIESNALAQASPASVAETGNATSYSESLINAAVKKVKELNSQLNKDNQPQQHED